MPAEKGPIMEAYAVVKTGGKQYLVKSGDIVEVETVAAEVGGQVDLSPVLVLSDGKELRIGKPAVEGAAVKAVVVEHKRGPKVVAFKKKRRKGYSKKIGHRQDLTVLKIAALA
jgi:large subunit ribosomal protein L21